MKTVFVDTSAFYAVLVATDPFHATATALFLRAEQENWHLLTPNYIVHETWAPDDFLEVMLPSCRIEFVTEAARAAGVIRCRNARLRHLSLKDCLSFHIMEHHGVKEAIAYDKHFTREGIGLP